MAQALHSLKLLCCVLLFAEAISDRSRLTSSSSLAEKDSEISFSSVKPTYIEVLQMCFLCAFLRVSKSHKALVWLPKPP